MIQINKPVNPPEILSSTGLEKTQELIDQYNANPAAYNNGRLKFSFDSKVYGHPTVKQVLRESQHFKCCFCEQKIEIGDVEHYRPKAGFQKSEESALERPGYFWCAYDWDNLLLCCARCNRSFKKNLFPLLDEAKRVLYPTDDLEVERPLFIHPVRQDPEQFIEYFADKPRAINDNLLGKTTIEKIGLNRQYLDERRFEHYKKCKVIFIAIQTFSNKTDLDDYEKQLLKDLQKLMNDFSKDSAEYAGMVRSATRNGFQY